MTSKGKKTHKAILAGSYKLFVKKGFKAVTMKDICEATGLSRGGLYRHFPNTSEIMKCLLEREYSVAEQIRQGIPARRIMEEQLAECRQEMLDSENSLSLAIYEFASVAPPPFFDEGNLKEKMRWNQLICYGIGTGEFKPVDADRVADLIMYAYQGVRMWSRVIRMDASTTDHVLDSIREMLYPEQGGGKLPGAQKTETVAMTNENKI